MPDVRPAVDFENRPAGESGLMLSERASTIRFLALIGVLTVGCDQASKWLARNSLGEDSRFVLGGVMELSLSHNPGGFLSLGAGLAPTTRAVVFTGATAAFVLASFVVLSVPTLHLRRRTQVGLALACAGSFGNLIDRLWQHGVVTDFCLLRAGPLHTGVFNLADVAIMLGALALVASEHRSKETAGLTPG